MQDFEKLGAFYLGRRYDEAAGALTAEPVLYDAKDLTTHAVIIGMTGSGKTGLGIGLLEEAALDHVPVIAIDPKGDMGNLLLTFPDLAPADFEPWVNARAAADSGQTPAAYAAGQAALWKKGLAEWGMGGERIAAFRDSADLAIYTPGSSAGRPLSVLKSFSAPAEALVEDVDLYRERIQATATGILTLIGVDADPVESREHILLSNLLDHAWRAGRSLDIAGLIAEIQNPPLSTIGVMGIDAFFPPKERFALAMRLNNLLAAPGFEVWMQGEPLSAKRLLYTDAGKPRISVVSIAHLGDAERMFFVSMLLNELIAWMRAQPGTSTLRAILYMDEVFGYLPPVANPPTKNLFLTLLKQARAYGLGLVLATQNPVDLDYKGLSNTGTWFIGRLQTERDKARVMEGLEGASQGDFDRQAMERRIAGLGKRRFLLHSVHEDAPVVFGTRWAMSYLAGPLTRDHLRLLAGDAPAPAPAGPAPAELLSAAPVIPPAVPQHFLPAAAARPVYYPRVLAAAELVYADARRKLDAGRKVVYAAEVAEGPVPLDWDSAERIDLDLSRLADRPADGAEFADCPAAAADPGHYPSFEKEFSRWVRHNETLSLYKSSRFGLTSVPGESEGDFRVRLQVAANEKRDREVAAIRKRYAGKVTTLENRLMRAEQAVEREKQQSTQKSLGTAVSVGTALLGALLGRKKLSATSASKIGTAIRSAGSARKEAGDVARAEETAEKLRQDLADLDAALGKEIAALDTQYDAQAESLEELTVQAKSTDVHVPLVALVWFPYSRLPGGRLEPAWR